MRNFASPNFLRIIALAGMLGACAQAEVRYPHSDFNDMVVTETCRKYITRAATVRYPQQAMQEQLSGYVVLAYELDGSGKAQNVRAVEARPPGVFDAAAAEALKQSDFETDVKAKDCRSVIDFTSVRRRAF